LTDTLKYLPDNYSGRISMITLGGGSRDEFGNPIPSGTYFIADEGNMYSEWRMNKSLNIVGSHSGSYFDWDTKTPVSSVRHQGGTAWLNTQLNQNKGTITSTNNGIQYTPTQTKSESVIYNAPPPSVKQLTPQTDIDKIFAPQLGKPKQLTSQAPTQPTTGATGIKGLAQKYSEASRSSKDVLGGSVWGVVGKPVSKFVEIEQAGIEVLNERMGIGTKDFNDLYKKAFTQAGEESFKESKRISGIEKTEWGNVEFQLTSKYNELNSNPNLTIKEKQTIYDSFSQGLVSNYNKNMESQVAISNLNQKQINEKYFGKGSEYATQLNKKEWRSIFGNFALGTITYGTTYAISTASSAINNPKGFEGVIDNMVLSFYKQPVKSSVGLGLGILGGMAMTRVVSGLGVASTKAYYSYVSKRATITDYPNWKRGSEMQIGDKTYVSQYGELIPSYKGKQLQTKGTYSYAGQVTNKYTEGNLDIDYTFKGQSMGNLNVNVINTAPKDGIYFSTSRGAFIKGIAEKPTYDSVGSFGVFKMEASTIGAGKIVGLKGIYVARNFGVESPIGSFSLDEISGFSNNPLSFYNTQMNKGGIYDSKSLLFYGKPKQRSATLTSLRGDEITFDNAMVTKYAWVSESKPFTKQTSSYGYPSWDFEYNVVNKGWGDLWATKPIPPSAVKVSKDVSGIGDWNLNELGGNLFKGGTSFTNKGAGTSLVYARPDATTIGDIKDIGIGGSGRVSAEIGLRTAIANTQVTSVGIKTFVAPPIFKDLKGGLITEGWNKRAINIHIFDSGLQELGMGKGGSLSIPIIKLGTSQEGSNAFAPIQIQKPITSQGFKEVGITKQVTTQQYTFIGLTGTPTPPVIPPAGGGFFWGGFIPPVSLDIRQPRSRKVKAKRIVRYTPSFGALIFGTRGKKPKGIETGLRVRPIPRGQWNFVSPSGSKSSPLAKILKRFR
jgi:hypothetical protein